MAPFYPIAAAAATPAAPAAPTATTTATDSAFISNCNPGGYNIVLAAAVLRFLGALRLSGVLKSYPGRAALAEESEEDLAIVMALEQSHWDVSNH